MNRRQYRWNSVLHITDSLVLLRRDLAIRERFYHNNDDEGNESSDESETGDKGVESRSKRWRSSPSADSLESFLNRPATISPKTRYQSTHAHMLDSIVDTNLSSEKTSSIEGFGIQKRHKGLHGLISLLTRAKDSLRRFKGGILPNEVHCPSMYSHSEASLGHSKRRLSSLARLRSSLRRPIVVSTAKAKERLYAAPESPRADDESDNDNDDEEGHCEGGADFQTRTRPKRHAVRDRSRGRGHWEWVDDGSMHSRTRFCLCFA